MDDKEFLERTGKIYDDWVQARVSDNQTVVDYIEVLSEFTGCITRLENRIDDLYSENMRLRQSMRAIKHNPRGRTGCFH